MLGKYLKSYANITVLYILMLTLKTWSPCSPHWLSSFLDISDVTECVFFLKTAEPPSFLVKPESQQAIPDSTVEFKAMLKGTPPFTVKWFKEDLELVSGPTCFIGIEGSTGFLTLYSVDSSRSGHYTCHISNDVGSDSCTTTLMVTGVHSFLLCCSFFVSFLLFPFCQAHLGDLWYTAKWIPYPVFATHSCLALFPAAFFPVLIQTFLTPLFLVF